jgi:hypothetical protein
VLKELVSLLEPLTHPCCTFDLPQGSFESVATGLAKGANVELEGADGLTALSLAAAKGHSAIVGLLLGRGKANPNTQGGWGYTPLYQAAWKGRPSVVRVLLEDKQTDVNLATATGNTPLMTAAIRGHTDVGRLLVELGHANPDLQNIRGCTALVFAAQRGDTDVMTLLLEQASADIHLAKSNGDTALVTALAFDHLPAAALLIIHGAQPNLAQRPSNNLQQTALQRGLALRNQVTQHRQHRRATVLGWLQEQGVPADVGRVVVASAGEVVVSEVLRELGISL